MDTGGAPCRSYGFSNGVIVDVFPELVTIAVPYDADYEDFVDASIFIERYTHGADASTLEDDGANIELHVYPNTENLISRERPCPVPAVDPRIKHWTEPRRRPVLLDPEEMKRPPFLVSLHQRAAYTEVYVQELLTRGGVGVFEALPKAFLAMI